MAIFLMLSRIRLRSYELLFNAKAQKETLFSKEKVFQTLQTINKDMFKMAQLMEPEVRPKVHNDNTKNSHKNATFQPLYDPECSYYVKRTVFLQMTFFSNLITINRITFLIDSYENDPVGFSLGNLALDVARTILKSVMWLM